MLPSNWDDFQDSSMVMRSRSRRMMSEGAVLSLSRKVVWYAVRILFSAGVKRGVVCTASRRAKS